MEEKLLINIETLEKDINDKNTENMVLMNQSGNKTLLYYKNVIEEAKDEASKVKANIAEKSEEMLSINSYLTRGDLFTPKSSTKNGIVIHSTKSKQCDGSIFSF